MLRWQKTRDNTIQAYSQYGIMPKITKYEDYRQNVYYELDIAKWPCWSLGSVYSRDPFKLMAEAEVLVNNHIKKLEAAND
jgi:hypothetical protein